MLVAPFLPTLSMSCSVRPRLEHWVGEAAGQTFPYPPKQRTIYHSCMFGLSRALSLAATTWCFVTAVASIAVASPTASEHAAAELLFDDTLKKMEAGNYAEACPDLEESRRLDPGIGTLLYLAQCYEEQGRYASGWAILREASYAAASAGQAKRQAMPDEHASRLQTKVSFLTLNFEGADLGSVTITRSDTFTQSPESIPSALWNRPIPIDAGEHVFSASAPGKDAWTTTLTVDRDSTSNGDANPLVLSIPPLRATAVALEPGSHAPTDEAGPSDSGAESSWGALSYVGFAAGLAGLVVGSATWLHVPVGT